ncbi:hypothetical protein DEI99_005120 [Curtobacterium sp. MCLR17_036]|uniref:hypothetical protein n=1 Tax=Curtobacterium sp. MCLR17_036 TaxID=2175620 RepID=UPI0011B6EC43|nr:hypothetical protein [Curtobacterium sp. MCLR17_036]WIE65920.1 hypothetical protein DEI99_005120 [Curtobacterium sp. MCLR17_036]
MATTTRTRADRVQQLATFFAEHPELDFDFSEDTETARPTLHLRPRNAADVAALVATFNEPADRWNTRHKEQGWVVLDSGALGYAAVYLHLPRPQQPAPLVDPAITGLFA